MYPPLILIIFFIYPIGVVGAAITVTDDLGQTVRLTEPAEKIVSLAPHVTELLFAAGAGEKLVGVAAYSDYPPQAKALPRVGGYDKIDMERILLLQPDLIVAWASGSSPRQIDQLKQMGYTVFLSEPRALEAIPDALEKLGELAGTESAAKRAASAFRRRYRALKIRYQNRFALRVFYEIWNQPLQTINGDHIISKIIALCGGKNIFAELGALAPVVSLEAVLLRDPEVIVTGGMAAERPEWLDKWKKWEDLTAVKRHNLFFIPPELLQRPTPRILDGMEMLCQHLERARNP